jgi:hypothetical protein
VPVREVDGLREVGVHVTIEDAPDLVVGPPASSSRIAGLGSLSLDGFLDELHGAASKGGDLDQYSVAVLTPPVSEV